MNDAAQDDQSAVKASPNTMPGPWRCLLGAIIAGGIAIALYILTTSIVTTFAAKGVSTGNLTAQRIAAAVRTLVIGLSALATGIFGVSAIGLFGLALQILVQRLKGEKA